MIHVDHVTKAYGTVRAVDDVTLRFEPGAVTGLLGPNGAGKTTLLKMALGLIEPTSGSATVDGLAVGSDPRVYRKLTAVLEGARNVYWRLTPLENMAFFASLQGIRPRPRREAHVETLAALGLAAKADEPVQDLSRGMKQAVSIACALARETPAILLDEPTLGLDVDSARGLRETLTRLATDRGKTVVLSTHDMALAGEVCDRVVVLNDGRVVADESPETLVELLATDRYRIAMDGPISEPEGSRLRDAHDIEDWRTVDGETTFSVSPPPAGSLYSVLADLRGTGSEITEISPVRPDFEDVFLSLTDRSGSGQHRGEGTLA